MARMRAVKQQLKDLLSAPDWRDHLSELRSMGQPAVGPLFSFLLLEPLMRHKAALALGQVVAGLEEGSAEDIFVHPKTERAKEFLARTLAE